MHHITDRIQICIFPLIQLRVAQSVKKISRHLISDFCSKPTRRACMHWPKILSNNADTLCGITHQCGNDLIDLHDRSPRLIGHLCPETPTIPFQPSQKIMRLRGYFFLCLPIAAFIMLETVRSARMICFCFFAKRDDQPWLLNSDLFSVLKMKNVFSRRIMAEVVRFGCVVCIAQEHSRINLSTKVNFYTNFLLGPLAISGLIRFLGPNMSVAKCRTV